MEIAEYRICVAVDHRLVPIDEPTEGLAPVVVEHLREIFKEISKNAALIIVEQNLSLVCQISDRVYAMKEGQVMSETSDDAEIKNIVFEKYL